MEVIQTTALISINATFVVQLVSFLIFVAIMNRVMFRPLREAMAKRKFRMRELHKEIADADKQLVDIEADLAEQKRTIREEANEVNKSLEAAASQQIVELFDATRQKTAAMRQTAEGRINTQLLAAREQVAGEARQLSTQIMQKILQRRLS